ncbi:family 16 glycosylhydrolase [Spirochaetia bacterium 38H-sp]|uniref:Family 16 glycosylhydrolase n=1 Tax=Rarispira pelagica TaxID=3141764 RepID=A0ABU9UCR9_9SPIR
MKIKIKISLYLFMFAFFNLFVFAGGAKETAETKEEKKPEVVYEKLFKQVSGNSDFSMPFSDASPDASGAFDSAESWIFYTNTGGEGNATIEDGVAVIDVTKKGMQPWAVQLLQSPIKLDKGGTYKLVFDAASESDGMGIMVKVGATGKRSWVAYMQQDFKLGTEMKTYNISFDMLKDTDGNARLEMWFLDEGKYRVDNFKLIKVGQKKDMPVEGTLTEEDEDKVEDWQLAWSDEFDGPEIDRDIWVFETGNGANGWGNNELEYYKEENAFIEDGMLVIEAKKETVSTGYKDFHYTSARMKTQGKYDFTYGRVEIRAKLPKGQGIWPALWMLGSDIGSKGWPRCGEVDIMELVGHEPSTVHGTIHAPFSYGANGIGAAYKLKKGDFSNDFHVFAIEWDEDEIEWYVDDVLYHVVNKDEIGPDWVFDHNFFFIFNVAVGGNWPGSPDNSTVFPQRMYVDYIRVYTDNNPASITGKEVWDCELEK